MPEATTSRGERRWIFSSLLCLFLLLESRYLTPAALPRMDMAQCYCVFHAVYNELFFTGRFPMWNPYGSCGMPFDGTVFVCLSATDHLMILAGRILGVRNTLALFQASQAAEHLIFLAGMFLISREIFARRSTALLVVIASLGALGPITLSFVVNLRLLTYLPIVLLLILRFLRSGNFLFLIFAGLVFLLWSVGASYLSLLTALTCALFLAFMLLGLKNNAIPSFRFSWMAAASSAAFLVFAAAYLYLGLHANDGLEVMSPGRDPATGRAEVKDFLTTLTLSPSEFLRSLMLGRESFYAGLLPLFFFAWALTFVRTPLFLAFAGTAAVLFWFSLGGALSLAVYKIPFFAQFRYIYLSLHILKIILVICAGFGWEDFRKRKRRWPAVLLIAACFVFVADLINWADGWHPVPESLKAAAESPHFRTAGLRVAAYCALLALGFLAVRFAGKRCLVYGALLLGLVADMLLYIFDPGICAAHDFRPLAGIKDGYPPYAYVRPILYQKERVALPIAKDSPVELSDLQKNIIADSRFAYGETYIFAGFDPWRPHRHITARSSKVARLHSIRPLEDPVMARINGAGAPKMRLMSRALHVDSGDMAEALTGLNPGLDSAAVIRLTSGAKDLPGEGDPLIDPGMSEVTGFTMNEVVVEAEVRVEKGAWLIYSDAFHPGWKAFVDGAQTPIAEAYVAFKAVRVPNGKHAVRFVFDGGKRAVVLRFVTIASAIGALAICVWLISAFLMEINLKTAVET